MADVPELMRASVLTVDGRIVMETRAVPVPAVDEVIVRVTAVGVCGSDVHFYREGRLGSWVVDEPLVLGHESGGVIVAAGAGVRSDRVGSRVSIEPQHPDATSPESLRGQYNLDPAMRFFAVPGTDGAFQEYVAIQSHFAHAVPDMISDHAAALMEPLSVAVAAIRKGGVGVGSRVLITGSGPIGVALAQVARAAGATQILVTDVAEERRRTAVRFGATAALDPLADAERVSDAAVDVYFDASGAPAAVRSGIEALRPGGRAVLVGMGPTEYPLPVSQLQNKEIELTGTFRYVNTWPAAIALAATGRVDLDGMVTATFGLADVQQALESTADPHTIKTVVEPTR